MSIANGYASSVTSAEIATPRLTQVIQEIRTEHEAVGESLQASLAHAIRLGLMLIEAKSLIPHGEWLPFLAENFTFRRSSAAAYMRVAKAYPDMVNVQSTAHLDLEKACG